MLMAPLTSLPLANCWWGWMSQQAPHPPIRAELKLPHGGVQPSVVLPLSPEAGRLPTLLCGPYLGLEPKRALHMEGLGKGLPPVSSESFNTLLEKLWSVS